MARRLAIGSVQLSDRAPRIVAAGGEAELGARSGAAGPSLTELGAALCEDPRPKTLPALLARPGAGGRPVILTARAAAEGGRPLEEARRRALYAAGLPHADAIDVEIASTALAADLVPQAHAAGKTVMLSAHALHATPPAAALLGLVDRAEALGADLTKLVTHARNLGDLRVLLEVTLVARARGIVTLATGPAGPLSRVVLPAAGSLLTYGHVGRPTAPSGQLPIAELAALRRRLLPPSNRASERAPFPPERTKCSSRSASRTPSTRMRAARACCFSGETGNTRAGLPSAPSAGHRRGDPTFERGRHRLPRAGCGTFRALGRGASSRRTADLLASSAATAAPSAGVEKEGARWPHRSSKPAGPAWWGTEGSTPSLLRQFGFSVQQRRAYCKYLEIAIAQYRDSVYGDERCSEDVPTKRRSGTLRPLCSVPGLACVQQ